VDVNKRYLVSMVY